jgi:hypothetical protein
MTEPMCGAAAFLRPGGPVRVPFRACCAAVLLHAAQASDAAPPPCPRRSPALTTAVPGDSLFDLPFVEVALHGEVIP